MKFFFISIALIVSSHAQIYYGSLIPNQGPAHGKAKNYGTLLWSGKEYVRSEIIQDEVTYSLIRRSDYNFKISKKEGDQFKDILNVPNFYYADDPESRIIHVSEDNQKLNLLLLNESGYTFYIFKKSNGIVDPDFFSAYFILNPQNTLGGIDSSIVSLEFEKPNTLKIIRNATTDRNPDKEALYEFRTDGLFKNGFYVSYGPLLDSQAKLKYNLQLDPEYYDKQIKRIEAYEAAAKDNNARDVREQKSNSGSNPETPPAQASNPTAPKAPELIRQGKESHSFSESKPSSPSSLLWLGMAGLTLFLSILGFVSYKKKFES